MLFPNPLLIGEIMTLSVSLMAIFITSSIRRMSLLFLGPSIYTNFGDCSYSGLLFSESNIEANSFGLLKANTTMGASI